MIFLQVILDYFVQLRLNGNPLKITNSTSQLSLSGIKKVFMSLSVCLCVFFSSQPTAV